VTKLAVSAEWAPFAPFPPFSSRRGGRRRNELNIRILLLFLSPPLSAGGNREDGPQALFFLSSLVWREFRMAISSLLEGLSGSGRA